MSSYYLILCPQYYYISGALILLYIQGQQAFMEATDAREIDVTGLLVYEALSH
jgi:hypothetical protein